MKERKPMNNEKRNCTDCFHCKVSAKSTKKCRLFYCTEKNKEQRHKEKYWQKKMVCLLFVDMADRRPLLNFNK